VVRWDPCQRQCQCRGPAAPGPGRPGPARSGSPVSDPPAGATEAGAPRLVVVRHGATAWSVAGRHTGRTDLPLLEEGRRQAHALGRRLRPGRFALVLTSPLARARETCVLAGFGAVSETCEDLREWDYGAYEGRTTDEVRAERPDWSLWRDGAPEGERAEDVGRRVDRVIAAVRRAPGDVLAFAHAHVLRVLAARWVGLGPEGGAVLVLEPATVSVLGWEREQPTLQRWNDAAGDPLA